MKYYIFYRENNNFDDILKDTNIKKFISERITWKKYLKIGINEYQKNVDGIFSYIMLKYSDDVRSSLTKDFSPVVNVDYAPTRNK